MKNLTSEDHFNKYENIVQSNGLSNMNLFSFDKLSKAYDEDKHLNSIPLQQWDSIAMRLPIKGSLAEKVCTLKHIAIYHILKLTPKFK